MEMEKPMLHIYIVYNLKFDAIHHLLWGMLIYSSPLGVLVTCGHEYSSTDLLYWKMQYMNSSFDKGKS